MYFRQELLSITKYKLEHLVTIDFWPFYVLNVADGRNTDIFCVLHFALMTVCLFNEELISKLGMFLGGSVTVMFRDQ